MVTLRRQKNLQPACIVICDRQSCQYIETAQTGRESPPTSITDNRNVAPRPPKKVVYGFFTNGTAACFLLLLFPGRERILSVVTCLRRCRLDSTAVGEGQLTEIGNSALALTNCSSE